VLGAQERQQLRPRVGFLDDTVADVRPVEAGHELARARQPQALHDFLARDAVGRRGERDARHAGKALMQLRQLHVLRAEVVAPLRHAVRLVDGEQRSCAEACRRSSCCRKRGISRRSGAT